MFFSEREQGPKSPTEEGLSDSCWRGLAFVIRTKRTKHWFAEEYPEHCFDGDSQICGTSERDLNDAMESLHLLPVDGEVPNAAEAMDLLEFCHKRIAKPISRLYHSFGQHYHMSFDKLEGQSEFREEINEVFRRNGAAYILREGGMVERVGPSTLGEDLRATLFTTGDHHLDSLLEKARSKFLHHRDSTRREAIDHLWDAWERLKTVEPGKKRVAADALIYKAAGEPSFRARLGAEARELTEIGNSFMIRHHETDKQEIASDEHVDYLFHRMFAMIRLLLRSSGRGG